MFTVGLSCPLKSCKLSIAENVEKAMPVCNGCKFSEGGVVCTTPLARAEIELHACIEYAM